MSDKKSIFKDTLYQPIWVMITFAIVLTLACIFVIWPEHDKATTELHKMPCDIVKQSVLGIGNNFWLHPEDYSKELALRCSK